MEAGDQAAGSMGSDHWVGSGSSLRHILRVDLTGSANPSDMRCQRKKGAKGDRKISGLRDQKDEFPFSLTKRDSFKVYSLKNLPQIPSGSTGIQTPSSFYQQGSRSTGNG